MGAGATTGGRDPAQATQSTHACPGPATFYNIHARGKQIDPEHYLRQININSCVRFIASKRKRE